MSDVTPRTIPPGVFVLYRRAINRLIWVWLMACSGQVAQRLVIPEARTGQLLSLGG
jgi:hypothetical protein